jgi:hypothetical protein
VVRPCRLFQQTAGPLNVRVIGRFETLVFDSEMAVSHPATLMLRAFLIIVNECLLDQTND